MAVYSDSFHKNNIIGSLNDNILQRLTIQLNPRDLLIETTWLHNGGPRYQTPWNKNLHFLELFHKPIDRVILYSGIDFNFTYLNNHNGFKDFIRNFNHIVVGNHWGKYYFSYWLEFFDKIFNSKIPFDVYDVNRDIKTFMCLNRKPHPHRQFLLQKIYDKRLDKYGIISLGKILEHDDKIFQYGTPIALEYDIEDTLGDKCTYGSNSFSNNITSIGSEINWNNHFLNVVTETVCSPGSSFISEKTLKPIIGRRPFVVQGDTKIYSILDKWGIDTFDDLFGKELRSVENLNDKVKAITNIIEIFSKENSLDKLLLSLKPRLEENVKALRNAVIQNSHKIDNLFRGNKYI